MGLMANDKGGGMDFDPIPAGVHHAEGWAVIDLGTQHNPKFNQDQHKVCIGWELPSERIQIEDNGAEIDKPKVISRIFTLSLSEKSHLRPFLESWRGRPFSPQELLGFDISQNIFLTIFGPIGFIVGLYTSIMLAYYFYISGWQD